ncbi:hypothetical protein ACHWQZ_G008532 [Mnemiopsis leidyi]
MTLLSQQLQKLALPKEQVKGGAIQHSSLIFSTRIASDYDVQDIYDIGINGFEELVTLNPCFAQFRNTLFHPNAGKFERMLKSAEFLAGVDSEIELFLAHVSNYGLLSPAHKALEWLVRSYKIHIYNSEALLYAFIPLHDSKVFAKILEITTLPDNWKWLETAKTNNVNVGRTELVKLCTSNPHYLTYFMERVMKMIHLTQNMAKVHHSFLVTLVFLVLEQFEEVPPDVIPKIYSCIITAITSSNKDLKSAGYIITGQVTRKITLKDHIVRELISTLVAHPSPSLTKELILCISCILHYHPVSDLPVGLIELMLQDQYILSLGVIYEKNDIGGLIKELLVTGVDLCFKAESLFSEKLSKMFQIPGLPEEILTSVVERYFELYFNSSQEIRNSDSVNLLGDMLSTDFSSHVQDTFQKFHSQGCDMEVLGQLKALILGKYLGNESAQKIMEINHDLPGIRMLGLLKISEKLESGSELSAKEEKEISGTIVSRITDVDDSVSLKSLEMIKMFLKNPIVVESVNFAVLQKVQSMVGDLKKLNQDTAVSLIAALVGFPDSEQVLNTLLLALVNFIPLCDQHRTKQIAVQLRSSEPLKKLSSSLSSSSNFEALLAHVRDSPARATLMEVMSRVPTPQHFKLLCSLVPWIEGGEVSVLVRYFVSLLNTAVDRKFEYKEMIIQAAEYEGVISKAPKFFKNFTIMKREWELVGLVLSALTLLAPKISSQQDIKILLLYLIRSCSLHPPCKPLIGAMDKGLTYSVAMKVALHEDPTSLLSSEGLDSAESLDHMLECLRLVKVSEQDLISVFPYLLCALVAPQQPVRSWAYKRLKTISKLDATSSTAVAILQKLQINKNIEINALKQEMGRVCSSDSADLASWLEKTLPHGEELSTLYEILGAVQHPAKLRYALQLIQNGANRGAMLGDFTPATTSLLLNDPTLLQLFFSAMETNPGLLAEALNPEFLGGLPDSSRDDIVRVMLGECNKNWEEHVKLTIRQKLTELPVEMTLPVMLSILKEKEVFNPHLLLVLNMQGAANDELATALFEILPTQKGSEEDIVALLTTVCSKLGKTTPLTPSALRAIVDVIRETNKETHRHALHHGCIVLLSKLAAHFPVLVLDHVIAIFTFMGDSTMRMDDNYSIQVLIEAISTIVPVIKQKKDMMSILRVFCDTLPHIPSHRADPIFSLLLESSGPQYIYHVFVFVLELCSRDREFASQFSYFLQNLTVHFGLSDLLGTSVGMIKTLAALPDKLTKMTGKTHMVRLDTGVELNFNDAKHYNYFKLGLVTQLYLLTTNKHFTGQLAEFEKDKGDESKLAELIELSLSIMIHYQDSQGDKFVDMLNKRLTGVTTSVTAGLPPPLFISVVRALLTTDTSLLHEKSLSMLLNRVKGESGWSDELEESMVSLLDTLLKLAPSHNLTWKVLELLVKKIGVKYPDEFGKVLGSATTQLGTSPSEELRGCICASLHVLGVRCVPLLADLVTVSTGNIQDNSGVLSAVVATVPQFMSAYIADILVAVSADYNENVSKLCQEIGCGIKLRVLLPAVQNSIETLLKSPSHDLRAVTDTLTKCVEFNAAHDIKNQAGVIGNIFVSLISYRDTTISFAEDTENEIITCFVGLVYKLTEKEFLPLLVQLLEWSDGSLERSISFYNLSSQLSDKLQGLFLLFGGSIYVNLVEKLKRCKPQEQSHEYESKKMKLTSGSDLATFALKTLYNMLRYDTSNSFITADRFETLLPVLLDLISLPDITHLSPALAQLPVAANSDRLWKQYNFQLLNLSKSLLPAVRQNVVAVYKEFVVKLGQDYSVLLPDSLPFIAELLEDSDPIVEERTHLVVKAIEDITGESIDQYL